MANAASVETTFECPICYETFTNARILPCGHSLCGPPRKCLSKILEGSHLCPIDRTDMHKNGGKEIKDFPVNYAIQSAIEQASRPTTSADKNYQSCDVHGRAIKLFCEDCETELCELCWEAHESEHKVILFKKHLESLQKQLLESEANINLKEEKIDKVIEDYEKLTAKWLAGRDLLSAIKNQFLERNNCVREMTSSTSQGEVMEKMSRFKLAHENMNKLKLQFEEECDGVMSKLSDVSSQMKATTFTLPDTVRKEGIQEIETEQPTKKFTTEVSPLYVGSYASIVVDSDSNIYVADYNWSDSFTITKMKATFNTNMSLDVIQKQSIKSTAEFLDIAFANNKLYGLFSSSNAKEFKLCELDKELLQIKKTLNTERVSAESLEGRSIKGKGSTLVLGFLYSIEVKHKGTTWWGRRETKRQHEVLLHVYEKDVLVNIVKSDAISNGFLFRSSSVGQYFIVCWKEDNKSLMNYWCIEWNQLKLLKTIPKSAFYTMEWAYDTFPIFFSLGNQVHAIVDKVYSPSAAGVWTLEMFSNVIRNGRIELNQSNQQIIEISNENIQQLSNILPYYTVYDNLVLWRGNDSPTALKKFWFLVKFENGGSQSQK